MAANLSRPECVKPSFIWVFINSLALGDVEVIPHIHPSNSFYELIYWVLHVKLVLDECHRMNPFNDEPTLVQVMAWYHQATTWTNIDPDLYPHVASLGHNVLIQAMAWHLFCTKPQSKPMLPYHQLDSLEQSLVKYNQTTIIFPHQIKFENVLCKMWTIVFKPCCVKRWYIPSVPSWFICKVSVSKLVTTLLLI